MSKEDEGHVIEGVPGHVAWRGWARELQRMLRSYGLSYEAELDHTRIHLKGVLIQVYPDTKGYVIDASLPLPLGDEDPDYLSEILEGFRTVLTLINNARGVRPIYELDTSLPYNPALHTIIYYSDPDSVISTMKAFLDTVFKAGGEEG